MAKHRHSWNQGAVDMLSNEILIGQSCKCGVIRIKKLTGQKRLDFLNEDRLFEPNHIHDIYLNFAEKFKKNTDFKENREWKYEGFELISGIEKWAKQYPDDVKLSRIADASYATSLLCLIQNRDKKIWHGLTVVVVSQCSESPPVEFFLYPEHYRSLIDVLQYFWRNLPKSEKVRSKK